MYPGAWVANVIRRRVLHQSESMPNPRAIFIVGWTGMRGVVALAAVISLPQYVSNGTPFPGRDLMVFITFCVIVVTLVLQGLALPPLIRRLGLAGTMAHEREEEIISHAVGWGNKFPASPFRVDVYLRSSGIRVVRGCHGLRIFFP
jgi:monovalent cation/hydrogen antiporter